MPRKYHSWCIFPEYSSPGENNQGEHSSTEKCVRKLSWHYTGRLGKTAFAPLLVFLSSTFDLAQNYCRFLNKYFFSCCLNTSCCFLVHSGI